MFLFKKIVSQFFFPLPVCLGLLGLGLFLLWGTEEQEAGKILVTLGAGLLVVLSYQLVPRLLLRPLEQKYAYLSDMDDLARKRPAIKWIVVLDDDLARMVEGIRLYRQLPGVKLLLSGGCGFGEEAGAVASARVARQLGVKPQDLVLETTSRDTEEEARLIKNLVGQDGFILITSASHLPRAMAMFHKVGLDPIPAPTGHLAGDRAKFRPASYFPGAGNLVMAETAVYEYLGLAWAWLRGAI